MSVFGENDSRCLSNFLKTPIFWKCDQIFRTYNQINYRNIWFGKVIIILLMTTQVLFFDVFFEKDPHTNAIEFKCFHLNFRKLPNYMWYFGSNNIEDVAKNSVEVEMSWVEVDPRFSNNLNFINYTSRALYGKKQFCSGGNI